MRTTDIYRIISGFDGYYETLIPEYENKLSNYFPNTFRYQTLMIDLGKTAKEKYQGIRKEDFKEDLRKLTDKLYQLKVLKELITENTTEHLTEIIDSWSDKIGYGKIYLYTILAQIDLEEPGYIEDFPIALNWIRRYRYDKDPYSERRDIYNEGKKYAESYNRYSGKNDLKCIRNILGIHKGDLEIKGEKNYYNENNYRPDDYISKNIHKFVLDNKNRKVYRYLLDNFSVQKEDLLPSDYCQIVTESGVKVEDKPTDQNDLDWVEIFFNYQDKIQETLDPRKIKPSTMKLLNRIILSGWK